MIQNVRLIIRKIKLIQEVIGATARKIDNYIINQ